MFLVLSFTIGPSELYELCASHATVQAICARCGCIFSVESMRIVFFLLHDLYLHLALSICYAGSSPR